MMSAYSGLRPVHLHRTRMHHRSLPCLTRMHYYDTKRVSRREVSGSILTDYLMMRNVGD
ncbi:hypothetical protein C8R48DRAFT_696880 [Suillus tomentosus]|nr:hypothetical protein C8R48DRAFT_696880 [Suillus tomentosus]